MKTMGKKKIIVALAVSLAFMMAAVPAALEKTEAASTIISDELPAVGINGDVAVVSSGVYRWFEAGEWFYPEITSSSAPAAVSAAAYFTDWYFYSFNDDTFLDIHLLINPNNYVALFATDLGGDWGWQFLPKTISIPERPGWIQTEILYTDVSSWITPVTGDIPETGPIGVMTLTGMIQLNFVSWEAMTVSESGWILIDELPSSGGTAADNEFPWMYVIFGMIAGIIVGTFAMALRDD